jgi:hypothetical protein
VAKWKIQESYADDGSKHNIYDTETSDDLVVEAETPDAALDVAYQNGHISRFNAIPA